MNLMSRYSLLLWYVLHNVKQIFQHFGKTILLLTWLNSYVYPVNKQEIVFGQGNCCFKSKHDNKNKLYENTHEY